MVPLVDIWAQSVKGLIDVVNTTIEGQGSERGPTAAYKLHFGQ